MDSKIEVTIDVIIHATEDIEKFFDAFEELFGIERKKFSVQNLRGHYDNPITMLHVKLEKKDAREFVKKLVSDLPNEQLQDIVNNLQERIHNSTLHLRLAKQKLVQGIIDLKDKDPIRLKIHIPVYNKKNTTKIYSALLQKTN